MASTLTAGNATNGMAVSSDNTGILELKTGTGAGTTAVTISTAQAVTFAGAATVTGVATLTGGVAGNLQFNSGYGSIATAYGCRAWVNFDGTAAGTFDGGASTVSRTAGSTTATVTTTTAHNLVTGNIVQALTGVAAGTYTITFISATQFSFTTVATTVLTAVSITFAVSSIRASGNVSSIADNGTGLYTANFLNAMSDANYIAVCFANRGSTGDTSRVLSYFDGFTKTTSAFSFETTAATTRVDIVNAYMAIFR